MKKTLGFFILGMSLYGSIHILWTENLSTYLPKKGTVSVNKNPTNLQFLSSNDINYLHFYDPSCLNSRINIDHLPSITKQYASDAKFFLIASGSNDIKAGLVPDYFDVIEDPFGEISRYCGISTLPSAIVHKQGQGSFFANYNNKNGLCGANDIKYSGPAIALRFMIEHDKFPVLPQLQQAQIGCYVTSNKL